MENHPIPQDVTGFQFKLIGSMTVKQFGYIAAGVIPAIILYYLPIFILIKVVFIPLFAGIGVALAFLPIEGRPMDVMIGNFIKAISSPNQYIYHKMGRQLAFAHLSIHAPVKKDTSASAAVQVTKQQKLATYLQASHGHRQSTLDQKEAAYLLSLTTSGVQVLPVQGDSQGPSMTPSIQPPGPLPQATSTPEGIPHESVSPTPALGVPVQIISSQPFVQPAASPVTSQVSSNTIQVSDLPHDDKTNFMHPDTTITPVQEKPIPTIQLPTPPLAQTPLVTTQPDPQNDIVKQQLEEIAAQKSSLEAELAHLKTQLSAQQAESQPQVPSPVAENQAPETEHVRKVPQNMAKSVGISLIPPDVANLITGIVKDSRGNVLGNILVEIKDKEGNPVRAFKTNPLGQFASATQLPDGVFSIEFEDPKTQHRFDTIEMTMNGSIIMPLEVISHDDREELRKALFN